MGILRVLRNERRSMMRRSRFTEEQIIAALKEHAAGTPAKELGWRLGVGVETLYRWKR
jgi:putative transposase